MGASIKNILIGIFVILAVCVIVFMLLFLHPSVGDNAKTLRVRFADIDKVNIGTRVTYAGRPVGEVVSISELPDARTSRVDQHGDVYIYELVLKVDSGVDVFNTDIVSLRTSGLLGERNIEIDPQPLRPGEKLIPVDDSIIYATPTGSVEETLKQFKNISGKFELVLNDLHEIMSGIQREKIVEKISRSVDNILEFTDSINQPQSWKNTISNIEEFSNRIHHSLDTLDISLNNMHEFTDHVVQQWTPSIDRSLEEFHQTAANAKAFTNKANQIIDLTRQGKGTMGKLFVDNDLYLRLKSILSKASTIMEDVKTYGVLFHNNKKWQRTEAGRLKLKQRFSDPVEFSQYFNNEVDGINTSLSNVNMILNESNYDPQYLMADPNFCNRFCELLKRVEGMEETLKMYNESIVNQ